MVFNTNQKNDITITITYEHLARPRNVVWFSRCHLSGIFNNRSTKLYKVARLKRQKIGLFTLWLLARLALFSLPAELFWITFAVECKLDATSCNSFSKGCYFNKTVEIFCTAINLDEFMKYNKRDKNGSFISLSPLVNFFHCHLFDYLYLCHVKIFASHKLNSQLHYHQSHFQKCQIPRPTKPSTNEYWLLSSL